MRDWPHPAMFTAEPRSKTHTAVYYFNVEALMRGTMAEGAGTKRDDGNAGGDRGRSDRWQLPAENLHH